MRSKDLTRVHDVLRIEGPLNGMHGIDSLAELLAQKFNLAAADTMFTRARSFESDGSLNQALMKCLRRDQCLRVVRVSSDEQVKVSIADVPHDRGD
jgi:hypothetical protein